MTGGHRCDRGTASVGQLRAWRRLLKRGRADGAASHGPSSTSALRRLNVVRLPTMRSKLGASVGVTERRRDGEDPVPHP